MGIPGGGLASGYGATMGGPPAAWLHPATIVCVTPWTGSQASAVQGSPSSVATGVTVQDDVPLQTSGPHLALGSQDFGVPPPQTPLVQVSP